MPIDPTTRLKRISRYLSLAWFGLVALATLAGALFLLIPNEALSVFGPDRSLAYAIAFIVVVAVIGLPLLIVAAMISRKARSGAS